MLLMPAGGLPDLLPVVELLLVLLLGTAPAAAAAGCCAICWFAFACTGLDAEMHCRVILCRTCSQEKGQLLGDSVYEVLRQKAT